VRQNEKFYRLKNMRNQEQVEYRK